MNSQRLTSTTNQRRAEQLGMPFGTANAKLRKQLLFQAIKKLGQDSCFKCGEKIEKIEEFTIEHKKSWLDISPELFWDLENIAYSHSKCNVPDRRYGGAPLRKIGPENTSWCTRCQEFEPLEKFHKDSSRWNGLQNHCMYNRSDR